MWGKRNLVVLASFFTPFLASAHEVYVLTPEEIKTALATPRFSLIEVLLLNVHEFLFWAAVGFALVLFVFGISVWRYLEMSSFPFFDNLRHHAPTISRITIGLSFIAAAYFGAAFGPELPLAHDLGRYAPYVAWVIGICGVCITIGFLTRTAAFVSLLFYLLMAYFHGSYLLTYINYLGEIFILLILGAHNLKNYAVATPSKSALVRAYENLSARLAPYSFLVLRVTFGISLLYASAYAKILHNNLALEVAASPLADHFYGIAHYLGFEPHFLVLGAAIVEIVLGICFIIGFEIRFMALFIEFWLALSLFYFGESVWPHIVLIGLPIALLFYGYDKYSIEGLVFNRKNRQPVL